MQYKCGLSTELIKSWGLELTDFSILSRLASRMPDYKPVHFMHAQHMHGSAGK